MVNKNYVAGRNFEYRIIKWLVDRGYYVVRSYASKGVFDLVLHLLDHPNFLERFVCKRNTQGKVKLKLTLKKRSDWESLLGDIKLTVPLLITRTKG